VNGSALMMMQNANAYLLFYRRRTSRPLGGKTHVKVEEARARAPPPDAEPASASADVESEEPQLPTPPSEENGFARLPGYDDLDEDPWLRSRGPLRLADDERDELDTLGLETFRTGGAGPAVRVLGSPTLLSPPEPVVEIPVEESTLEDIE
jgi:hypothetical protein